MSLLTIVQALAKQAGVDVPQDAYSHQDRDIVMLVAFSAEAADECVRRADFGALKKRVALPTPTADGLVDLPGDFLRLSPGATVFCGGTLLRGGLSDDEWLSLPAVSASPRLFRRLGRQLEVWPRPPAGTSVIINYVSSAWCSNGNATWGANGDSALIPEVLLIKGALWRWRRHLGLDFADHLAEFEAALADHVTADSRMRAS